MNLEMLTGVDLRSTNTVTDVVVEVEVGTSLVTSLRIDMTGGVVEAAAGTEIARVDIRILHPVKSITMGAESCRDLVSHSRRSYFGKIDNHYTHRHFDSAIL